MKPKNRVYCLAIGRSKMLFESEKKANRFIEFNEDEIRETGTKKFKNLRSYYCITCGGWHITHADLSEKEIKEKDSKINTIISKTKEKENKNTVIEERFKGIYSFIKGFDLKSFGSKKKFKKYLLSNPDLIPKHFEIPLVCRTINEMPIEYFTGERELKKEEELDYEEIQKIANDLYNELPLSKLTSTSMIEEYIKWEFLYKRDIPYLVIKELYKLCGL